MKKPSINLSKESIVDFFLNHGEKLVVGLFGALACTLVWGGRLTYATAPFLQYIFVTFGQVQLRVQGRLPLAARVGG